MGYIELTDGVTNRRIHVPELYGTIEIDVTDDRPHLTVPDGATVDRESGLGVPR